MADVHLEIASHTVREGMCAVRLFGAPSDGEEVGIRDPSATLVKVNGPRHGDHRFWVTHLYARRGSQHEFVTTEVVPISAWLLDVTEGPRRYATSH